MRQGFQTVFVVPVFPWESSTDNICDFVVAIIRAKSKQICRGSIIGAALMLFCSEQIQLITKHMKKSIFELGKGLPLMGTYNNA